MSKYKKLMFCRGVMQKELLDDVRRTDTRIDKSLLSKIVNDICLPTRPTLDSICKSLSCSVLDIYDVREIDLIPKTNDLTAVNTVATQRTSHDGKSHGDNIYNLTVEIPRDVAERVFNKTALQKLGYSNKTDFVRRAVEQLDGELSKILDKEKVDTRQ